MYKASKRAVTSNYSQCLISTVSITTHDRLPGNGDFQGRTSD